MKIYEVCIASGDPFSQYFTAKRNALTFAHKYIKRGEYVTVASFEVGSKKEDILAILNEDRYASNYEVILELDGCNKRINQKNEK